MSKLNGKICRIDALQLFVILGLLTYYDAVTTSHFKPAGSPSEGSNYDPPLGICTHCRNYARNTEEINQKCQACNTGLYVPRRREKDWLLCAGCVGTGLAEPARWRSVMFAAVWLDCEAAFWKLIDDVSLNVANHWPYWRITH
jgi:hypothetical protein